MKIYIEALWFSESLTQLILQSRQPASYAKKKMASLKLLCSPVESNLTSPKSMSCQVRLHLISAAVGLESTTERLLTGPQVEVNWMCHSSQDSRWYVAPFETLSFSRSRLWSESLAENVICHIQLLSTATICPHLFSLYDSPPYSPHPLTLTGQHGQTVGQVEEKLSRLSCSSVTILLWEKVTGSSCLSHEAEVVG